jgi:hypothetical protein
MPFTHSKDTIDNLVFYFDCQCHLNPAGIALYMYRKYIPDRITNRFCPVSKVYELAMTGPVNDPDIGSKRQEGNN